MFLFPLCYVSPFYVSVPMSYVRGLPRTPTRSHLIPLSERESSTSVSSAYVFTLYVLSHLIRRIQPTKSLRVPEKIEYQAGHKDERTFSYVRPYVGDTHFSGMFDLPLRVWAKQQHKDFIILRSTKISLFHYFAISLLDIEMSSRCQLLYYYNNEITIIILMYYYC